MFRHHLQPCVLFQFKHYRQKIASIDVSDCIDCGLSCLKAASCFSYNLAVFLSVNGKLLCELLPYHKYNNLDKLTYSAIYNHLSVPVRSNVFVLAVFDKDLGILRSKMERNVFRVLYLI